MAKKHAFFFRLCDPLPADFQTVTGKNIADTFGRVTVRKEKPESFAGVEIKNNVLKFNPPAADEMEIRHHPLQTQSAGGNGKTEFTVAGSDPEVEQEGLQPVAGE